jgi:ABC-type uncharacterized transport system permease subunit
MLTGLALAFYLLATVCYTAGIFLRAAASPAIFPISTTHSITHFGRPLVLAGIALQFAAIGVWCVTTHRTPFASNFGTLSLTAWAMAMAFLILDWRINLPAVGVVTLPAACVALFLGILKSRAPLVESPLLTGQLVSMHVLAVLFSFGLLTVAAICSALYMVQNRQLRRHHVRGMLRRLPPLETLDRTAYQAVAFALPLLTLGILLGFTRVFGDGLAHSPVEWLRDPHVLTSLAAWLLYVFYLGSRLAAGWRGVRVQYILLVGFVVLLAIYFVPTTTHRFE